MGDGAGLDALDVFSNTEVGWDAALPPNEVVDEEGRPANDRGFGEPDPRCPPTRDPESPEVQALRAHLQANNGIRDLEICGPDEVRRATAIYRRDGFVVVRDLLQADELDRFRDACARGLREMLSRPGPTDRRYVAESGRLPHRYCYGTSSCSRQMMHDTAWTSLIDLPTTTPILREIFATDDYLVWGGGGDLSLPGAMEYQHLHTDGLDPQDGNEDARLACCRRQGIEMPEGAFADLDFRTQRLVMDRTPPGVTINFVMSDLTWENGPIRQIPGTHTATERPPLPADEPEWMRLSTLVGAPAGSGILRDTRAWHGATPNLSRQVRALPSIEYAAGWRDGAGFQKTMPYEIWTELSPHARHICRHIVEAPEVWPYGAGELQPLAARRREGYERAAGEAGEVKAVYTDPSSAGTAVRLFNHTSG